jgi:hypothetical protein
MAGDGGRGGMPTQNSRDHLSVSPLSDDMKTDNKYHHILAIMVACSTFIITILFTSGAFGHQLGRYLMLNILI